MTPEEIQAYAESLDKEGHVCGQESCPFCGRPPGEKRFRRVCKRRRTFLVVLEALVRKIRSLLLRWRCPWCLRIFTDYPPWAVPYRRYVRDEIEERSARYLEDDTATYRAAVRDGHKACGYDLREDGSMDERQLAASTLHRWISWLAAQIERLSVVLRQVRSLVPRATLHRDPLPIPARKYRSEERRAILHVARRLLHAEALVAAARKEKARASEYGTAGVEK
jgi:hypothetical protein